MKLNFKNTLKPAVATTAGFALGLAAQPQIEKIAALPQVVKDYGTGILGIALAAGLGKALKIPMATEIGVGMIIHSASRHLPRLLGNLIPSSAAAPAPGGGIGTPMADYTARGLATGISAPGRVIDMPRSRDAEGDALQMIAALVA